MTTEPTNWDRADWAATALQAYHSETRFDTDTYGDEGSEAMVEAFQDLLGDLRHLAFRADLDWDAMDTTAAARWAEEIEEEADPPPACSMCHEKPAEAKLGDAAVCGSCLMGT